MREIKRARELTQIVFDGINSGKNPILVDYKVDFKLLNKNYTDQVVRMTFAIATGRGYLEYYTDSNGDQRVKITHTGLMLISNRLFYSGEVMDTIGKLQPLVTWLLSVAAIVISIVALNKG